MTLPAAVVFDLDGTLFDHAGSARRALDDWLPRLGVPTADPDVIAAWFDMESKHYAEWRDGLISFDEQRRRRLREFLPLAGVAVGTDDELDALFGAYLQAYESAWRAYEDVDAGLSAVLALGLSTAVLTNGVVDQQRAKVRTIGLADRVGRVITAEELGVAKPRPEAFTRTCARLDLQPRDVLYVGDDHEVDVLAARAAGLRAVHLDREGAGPFTESQRITTLRDLPDHLVGGKPG